MFYHPPMQSSFSSSSSSRGLRGFLIYHLPVILCGGAIIGVSSVPNLRTPEVKDIAFDKAAHFIEYAIFAYLTFRSYAHWPWMAVNVRGCIFAALFLTAFAILDEAYQQLIPGRFSSGYDVLADLCGALLVLAYFEVRRRRLAGR